MWDAYLHHITVHFPIVMSLVLAAVGVWYVKTEDARLFTFVRVAGAITASITLVAVISGLVTAQHFWTEEGPDVLIHHRNLGITVLCVMLIAAAAVEWGHRADEIRAVKFGALLWVASAFGVLGAGHWGGSGVHSDVVPWDRSRPEIVREAQGADEAGPPELSDEGFE